MRIDPASSAMACTAISFCLWSCRTAPDYPIPVQRPDELRLAEFKIPAARIVNMSDISAPLRFVPDITGGQSSGLQVTPPCILR
jgi:hypothetical protein